MATLDIPSPGGEAGAVVYPPGQPPEALLAAFAAELKARGFRVGGLLQETITGEDDRATDMLLVEADTGRRLSIAQSLGRHSGACNLDSQALAEASGALRRAVSRQMDLVLVNKFSKAEKAGGGFADELLAAMAEGLPVLTAVPGTLIADWTEMTGGRCRLIAPDMRALWRWWGPHRLYEDLMRGVAEVPARRVVVGFNWVMVEGPDGVGLAQTPQRDTAGCRAVPAAGGRAGMSLRALAGRVLSVDAVEAAIGAAAINAHYNRFDLEGEDVNGLDCIADSGDRVVVVGAFPGIGQRIPGCVVVERAPGNGRFPDVAADWLLPGADAVVATAASFANRSLPRLLERAPHARVGLVGPGAPLTDRLAAYGVSMASGMVAQDSDGLARAVAEGAGAGDLRRFCRRVTVRCPRD